MTPRRLLERPTARAVALFEGLNLCMVVLYALAQMVFAPGATTLAARILSLALVVVVALAAYAVLLVMLRPGRRSRLERAILIALGALVVGLVSRYLFAFLSLALVPIAARYWLPLRRTLVLAAALVVWSAVWTALMRGGSAPSVLGAALVVGLAFLVVSAVFGAYTLLSFEFAVREAEAREALAGDLERRERMRALELENASLAERNRIAQELHDTLGHHLTAQGFDLQVVERLDPGDDPRRVAALQRAGERNRAAIEDLRRAVHAQRRPAAGPAPERADLAPALRSLLRVDGFEAHLTQRGAERSLPEPVTEALLQVAREAVTNAMKHAPSETLGVELAYAPHAVTLRARNRLPRLGPDAGVDPPRRPPTVREGLGLSGLRRRIEALGGRFEAGTVAPADGSDDAATFALVAEVPVPSPTRTVPASGAPPAEREVSA